MDVGERRGKRRREEYCEIKDEGKVGMTETQQKDV